MIMVLIVYAIIMTILFIDLLVDEIELNNKCKTKKPVWFKKSLFDEYDIGLINKKSGKVIALYIDEQVLAEKKQH